MKIENDSRQIPSQSFITKEKDYCDLLYAWLQCNSERVGIDCVDRKIAKKKVKWAAIERDFIRVDETGKEYKIMSRKTVAKYFQFLVNEGLVIDQDDDFYYLKVLGRTDANLIEYRTLVKMMNVLQRNCISVYVYLFNRYYANGCEPFIATMKQIKEFIGIATSTTSNNVQIADMIEFLERLGLLHMEMTEPDEDNKTYMEFQWVRNKLPELEN